MKLDRGSILGGAYKLLRRIGEGGMGSVWVAEHVHLERRVAIKVMSRAVDESPEARARFVSEARATAKVDSPHVVRVFDFDFTERGHPFLVLELLEGETLDDRIERAGPLSIDEAREVLVQATRALRAAHEAGVLHRDIKAENLFLCAGDRTQLKLIDFGIALDRPAESAETSGAIGTPHYMSAEQLASACDVDERSDLFSLGVCMYYALTGRFPFDADTYPALTLAIHTGVFTPPSWLREDLDPDVDAWFEKALARAPGDRFANAKEMSDAFLRACDSRATPVGVEVHIDEEPRPRRRRSFGAAMVIFFVLGAAALASNGDASVGAPKDAGTDRTIFDGGSAPTFN